MAWYSQGIAFSCVQCGRCCGGAPGFVWISEDEITQLATSMKMPCDEFERQYVRLIKTKNRKSLNEEPNFDCCLLDQKTGGCRVYDARPIQCRTWPFWRENLTSQNEWNIRTQNCAGCGRGRGQIFTAEEIDAIRKSF